MNYKYLVVALASLCLGVADARATAPTTELQQTAQTLIYGRILGDGGNIDNATVYVEGTNIHTTTNERGEYRLTLPRAGSYTLIVSRVGHSPYKQSISLQEGERKQMDVRLRLNRRSNLRELVVTANRKKRKEQDLGFAMQVVETQRVATQTLQTSELLERSAGVKVRQDGGLGSHTHFNLNGFSGNGVRIFVDGIPADNLGASFSIQSIPPALLERIEVFKGVVPGYLASDALGGAINIVLKEQRRNSLQTSYSFGSFNTHQWDIAGSFRSKWGGVLEASAYYNYSDNDYEVWGKEIDLKDYTGRVMPAPGRMRRFHDAYRSYGTRIGVGLQRKPWADKLMLTGTYSNGYKEMQHGSTMRNVYGDRHNRNNSFVLGLNYQKRDLLLKGLDLTADVSHSWLSRQVIDTVGIMYSWAGPIYDATGEPIRYSSGAEVGSKKTLAKDYDRTLMLRTMLSYAIDDHSQIHAGYLLNSFRRSVEDELENPVLLSLSNIRNLTKGVASLTYERSDFDNRLRSSIFYKNYNQIATSYEPYLDRGNILTRTLDKHVNYHGYGLTLAYAITPKVKAFASGERALRMPMPNELFGNSTENLLPPAQELEPERSDNINLGVNYQARHKSHRWGVNATLIYRDTKGMIRQAIMGGSFDFSRYENLENVLSYGADVELSYDYSNRLEAKLSLSKLQALFNTEFDAIGDRYQYYRMHIRNEPSFKLNAHLSYTQPNLFMKGARASVYTNVNYVEAFNRDWSNVGSANLAIIPSQLVTNVGVSYAFPKHHFTLSLDGKNIFDRQVYDNYGLQKPGRALFVKLSYRM